MTWPTLSTGDGRRAWAFLAILGGCVTMTLFAAVGVYLTRNNVGLAFWLAMAAHMQVLVGMTGLIAMFVKRSISITRDGISLADDVVRDGDAVTIAKESE